MSFIKKDFFKRLDKALKELEEYPDQAIKLLIEAGVYDKHGNLTEHYK